MIDYFEYINLPKIPNNLIINNGDHLRKNFVNVRKTNLQGKSYTMHDTSKDLKNFLQPYFKIDLNKNLMYQVIGSAMPVHIDHGRFYAINYLIEPGGPNVETFWTSDNKTVICKTILDKEKWCILNSHTLHSVNNIQNLRVAITISIRNKIFNLKEILNIE